MSDYQGQNVLYMSFRGTGHNEQDILRTKCPLYVLYILIINVVGVHGTYTGHIRDIYGTYTRLVDILSYICPIFVLCHII